MDTTKPIFERMALSVMKRYTQEQVKWHYEHGLVLQAILNIGDFLGNPTYKAWVKSMFDTKITENGGIVSYREGEFNLDQINMGKLAFVFFAETCDEKYRKALETLREQLKRQPRTKTGGFWHKQIYPFQMWLDGLYMAEPFYAQYTVTFNQENKKARSADFDDIVHQFVLLESKAMETKTGLLYHAWDESHSQRWANPETGCSPHFWGRAMGWFGMALVDVLDFIPYELPSHRQTLLDISSRLVDSILRYQDVESGLWYQVLDADLRHGNYLETSCSAMFTYFLYKLLNKGYAEHTKAVRSGAESGFRGVMSRIREDTNGELHLGGICAVAGLGGNPYRDGSFTYYVGEPVVEDDFKGVGPFILALLEAERFKEFRTE
ncbi:MAG: glycoside hydrolase family 88 protein [Treponema sp.]|jgi:unsaturated rhamnogalacturonyl hydrolase|nr:glycoside hydrolase family 88 protein [Treponema sp.]